MTTKHRWAMLLMFATATLLLAPTFSHAVAPADTKDQLKEKFKQRLPELTRLLDQGKVGETWEGYVEVVKKDSDLDAQALKLISNENEDRKKLYEIIAGEQDKKLTSAEVGVRNAARKFEDAKPDWYLKSKDGAWVQRKDVARFKHEGKIGEQWDGYLGAVKPEYDKEPAIRGLILIENRIRKVQYEHAAVKRGNGRKDEASVAAEAERAGRENLDKASPGEYVKPKTGDWTRK